MSPRAHDTLRFFLSFPTYVTRSLHLITHFTLLHTCLSHHPSVAICLRPAILDPLRTVVLIRCRFPLVISFATSKLESPGLLDFSRRHCSASMAANRIREKPVSWCLRPLANLPGSPANHAPLGPTRAAHQFHRLTDLFQRMRPCHDLGIQLTLTAQERANPDLVPGATRR